MAHEFEIREQISLAATPDEVWAAIATGPGVDSWFMGRTAIEPRAGGRTTRDLTDVVGVVQEATVSAWEPGRRFAFREQGAGDAFEAVEYLLEGRDGGSTVLRFAHHGILGDDDWEAQYEGMRTGDRMFLDQLAVYLQHFAGRHATGNVFLVGAPVPDDTRAWSLFASALSVTDPIVPGATIRFAVPGLPATEGVVAFVAHPDYVGVRTEHGIHVLMRGYGDTLAVGHHGFGDDDEQQIAAAWRAWLASTTDAT